MTIILFAIFWLVGLFITSFTLLPILIIFAFGIPTTKKLEKMKLLKQNNGIIRGYFISLIILSIIFLIMIMITKSIYPNGLIGILFGGGMVLLIGLGQIGKNAKNISDYVETNKDRFLETPETIKYLILGWK